MYNQPQSSINQEALAYCFSAVLSMLDLAIIQNQAKVIYSIITKNLLVQESPQVGKYGVIALQFLLHSKTEA
jgi:hypothetical protein